MTMKYISLKSVVEAYSANRHHTKNKFWGLLSILSNLDSIVQPGVSYDFLTSRVATFLESLFCIDDTKREYQNGATWNIMLSNQWTVKVSEQMLNGTPNIYDVATWYFRDAEFKDDIKSTDLISLFLSHSNISIEDAKDLFDFREKEVEFVSTQYDEFELQKALKLGGTNITAEGATIVAHPGELSRAPFIQTLYAGQSTLECLIITPFRFGDLYYGKRQQGRLLSSSTPSQTIFYGSPGTGKSWTVQNNVLKDVKEDYIFRTTFHPDTDYSTFIGCYKPISKRKVSKILSYDELEKEYEKYKPLYKTSTEANANFIKDYAESLLEASKGTSLNQVVKNLFSTGNDTYFVEMVKLLLGERDRYTSAITYDFVPQVFTEAYVKAWQNPTEQVYLVIEEINRGNCAQIFGDLFQLLDRKKGVSEYPVKAETALAEYLSSVLEGDAAEGIRDGKLSLPANLNIIATMNTSDQSLFPMDSAFKRRWDWKYIPTTPPADKSRTMELSFKDKTTTKYGTTIDAGDYEYDWTEFLEKINEKIQNATHSDDKQLGFWFVKTEEGAEEITISSFVSKVVFYLWNDVFKDMGAKDSNPFTIKVDGKNVVMSFNSFFEMNSFGQIVENIGVLHTFLRNVGVEPKVKKAIADAQDAAQAKEMTEEA